MIAARSVGRLRSDPCDVCNGYAKGRRVAGAVREDCALGRMRMQWPKGHAPVRAAARSHRAPIRANSRAHAAVEAFCLSFPCFGVLSG